MTAAAKHKSSEPVSDSQIADVGEEACYILKGHSGASVVLHVSPSRNFVRKMAGSPSSNDRLLNQIEKQRSLSRSGIPFPDILASGISSIGCAFFDMAYVPGRTVADAVANATTFDVNIITQAIEKMLWLFQLCKDETIPEDQIRSKIDSVENASRKHAANVPAFSETIERCADALRCRDWRGMPNSPSHGDLTLENILLTAEGGIIFIDCDETWVSSYWLDVGKLFQDVYGHWCLRHFYLHPEEALQYSNAVEKLGLLGKHFRALVESCDPRLADRLHQLAALNLFRALPYTTESGTASFICQRILRLLER